MKIDMIQCSCSYIFNRDNHNACPRCGKPYDGSAIAPSAPLGVTCLSGSLKGRRFTVGGDGLVFGRDQGCGVAYSASTPGISRQHCLLQWQGKALTLTDLGSTYGTYLGDGRRIPPHTPIALAAGARFYLASPDNLFQIVISL